MLTTTLRTVVFLHSYYRGEPETQSDSKSTHSLTVSKRQRKSVPFAVKGLDEGVQIYFQESDLGKHLLSWKEVSELQNFGAVAHFFR